MQHDLQKVELYFKQATKNSSFSRDENYRFWLQTTDHNSIWPLQGGGLLEPSHYITCLELIDEGCLDEIMPEDYTPFDYNLWRILGFDMN
jgi:hypothetical protein